MTPDDETGDTSPLRGEVGAQRRVRGGSPRVKALRHNPADAERRLWAMLRNRQLGGHKFLRQVAIGPYIADFVCREDALVVEVDGGQHSESQRDETKSPSSVHDVILAVLERHPSPGWRYSPADLSPEGRGTRGASAATTRQRSDYLDHLARVGAIPSKEASS